MLVVTVTFAVNETDAEPFRAAVLKQAHNSLQREADCHQFDVAGAADDPCAFFLYEVYTDEAAFVRHADTEHFKQFQQTVAPWVKTKQVRKFNKLEPRF